MMSFMMKKKRFKFQITFDLEELSNVPFVSGILFAKIRLLEGGSFIEMSSREEVCNNCVKWNFKSRFLCKMSANANTGILEPCIFRVSVRREQKGGKAYQKLGFVDVNLAEFAGSGAVNRRFLLEGYNSKNRQDNSTLKVTICVQLMSGDPVFKVPTQSSFNIPGESIEEGLDVTITPPEEVGSLASNSSGFGSLPRRDRPSIISHDMNDPEQQDHERAMGHSRNSSYASQHSRGSGYGSMSHSRQSSTGTGNETLTLTGGGHTRSPSTGSTLGDPAKAERRRKLEETSSKERRVDQSRVDNDDLVEELLRSTNLQPTEQEEASGLQLLVGKDGTMALR
ncbi:hypothetical protein ACJMK2_039469 [Sinanodonta woodiana]|uniref:C2 NT-type domain-containing protein n=1 Tax=Sinanodonta woodiana TaxID=1069815 RepID=A0ABD3WE33_SINWO